MRLRLLRKIKMAEKESVKAHGLEGLSDGYFKMSTKMSTNLLMHQVGMPTPQDYLLLVVFCAEFNSSVSSVDNLFVSDCQAETSITFPIGVGFGHSLNVCELAAHPVKLITRSRLSNTQLR